MKRAFFSVIVISIFLLVLLAAIEAFLRLRADPMLHQQLDVVGLMHWEDGRGLVLEPNADRTIRLSSKEAVFRARTNASGLRLNGNPDPPPDQPCILVMGDSMAFGFGVEDERTWPSVMERELGVRVINAGFRSGGCPAPQAVYLRDQALSLDPDLVLLGFYTGNDLTDLRMHRIRGVDSLGLPLAVHVPGGRFPPIFKRTAIYQYFGMRTIPRWMKRRPLQHAARPNDADDRAGKSSFFPYEPEWSVARPILTGMARLCRAHDTGFAVLVIPNRVPQDATRSEISNRLTALGREAGFPVLDLEPLFARDPEPARFFFPIDGHLNTAGCAFLAEAALPFIRSQLESHRDDTEGAR